ncbi:MAG: DUF1929 domain-containing protein [Lewinella sp.]|nr:DUF1929 domain-containing protein [Lewinella sp.]
MHPYTRLHIHVWNCDKIPHSFHTHGLEYGIDSDGAWPFGTQTTDGRRSDEICPDQRWTYIFEVYPDMIGVWPFHDHAQPRHMRISAGLFGGIVVLPWYEPLPQNLGLPPFLINQFLRPLFEREGKEDLQVDRIKPENRYILNDALDFFEEYMEKEVVQFMPKPIPIPLPFPLPFPFPIQKFPRTDHVPVFFHLMSTGETKPLFDSGDIPELGGFFELTFDEEGMFDYFCQFHPDMTGTVHVIAGGPANATVNIVDGPPMGFSPPMIMIGIGGTVRWENLSVQHHTVTSADGANIPSHCINGRNFVGNSPTIVAPAGQRLRWYVFNLDTSQDWHNFHPHAMRWSFAGQTLDIRSMGPAESFIVEAEVPPVLLLDSELRKVQDPETRPQDAQLYRIKGDYVFHCHVHHHLMNGMVGLVRSVQSVWLTKDLYEKLRDERGIQLYWGLNACPDVDRDRCKKRGEGKWEIIAGDPEIIFMHSVLLPNTNKVLFWGYMNQDELAGRPLSRLWDYATPAGAYSNPANQPIDLPGQSIATCNLWSAEHTHLDTPNGDVLINGGFTPDRTFLFDPATETYTETDATTDERFYATTFTLADGRAITLFGSGSKSMEIYTPGLGWSAPVNFPVPDFSHHQYYPWTYQLPDGRLFIAGPHDPTHRFDLANPAIFDTFSTINGNRSTGGEKASSVMQILRPPAYEPQILIIGGDTPAAEQTAEIINMADATPTWTALPNLNEPRNRQFTSVLLPDGRVFISGGVTGGTDGGPCEIYDPQNPGDGWKLGPHMTHKREYHSSIILLADGSIVAGGDPRVGGLPTPHERYYPNYFTVVRPAISSAPATINYGDAFVIDTPDGLNIAEVILLRPGSVTHGYNMTQRGVECVINATAANLVNTLAPPNANIAPHGWYLLFILDIDRVPSVGRWIRLTS